jgi:cis-L-3-hydroxyproline dehydratase
MILSKEEEEMATGKLGLGKERCINFLIKFGKAFGADKLVKAGSAHVYNAFPIDLLEKLTEDVEQAGTYTTIHPFMSLFDPLMCEKMGMPKERCMQQNDDFEKREQIYRRIGFFLTYTCVPHLVGNFPRKGDYVSWFGSSGQTFVNSIVGARQNQDGAVVNMAIAITGRAPNWGLYLDENRYGRIVMELDDSDSFSLTTTDLGAIGYYTGEIAGDRNAAITGLNSDIVYDKLKYLIHPVGTSGSVSICHLVGITPEAPDLNTALGNKKPEEHVHVGMNEIKQTTQKFRNGESDPVDLAILGCPHCSIQELKKIASILEGTRIGHCQSLWIGASYQITALAKTMGYVQIIENAGGIIIRSCMATIPDCPIPDNVKNIVTNSFKAAAYITSISKGRIKVVVGEIAQCVNAVISGKWKGEN